jgi:phosphonate transport system substrate-binding protein
MLLPGVSERMFAGFGGQQGNIVVHTDEFTITSGRNTIWPLVINKIKQSPLLGYGRFGSDEDIKSERQILANLIWSPFNPSSDRQLIPIRKLEANRDLMRAQADDKLSDADKAARVAKIKAEIASIEQMEKKAESDPYNKRVAAFVAADQAHDKDAMKRMISEFAADFTTTH